jgi:hypothetical protein
MRIRSITAPTSDPSVDNVEACKKAHPDMEEQACTATTTTTSFPPQRSSTASTTTSWKVSRDGRGGGGGTGVAAAAAAAAAGTPLPGCKKKKKKAAACGKFTPHAVEAGGVAYCCNKKGKVAADALRVPGSGTRTPPAPPAGCDPKAAFGICGLGGTSKGLVRQVDMGGKLYCCPPASSPAASSPAFRTTRSFLRHRRRHHLNQRPHVVGSPGENQGENQGEIDTEEQEADHPPPPAARRDGSADGGITQHERAAVREEFVREESAIAGSGIPAKEGAAMVKDAMRDFILNQRGRGRRQDEEGARISRGL